MTTKIKLPNIDTTYDYSSLVGSTYAQANGAFQAANAAFAAANTAISGASTETISPFLLMGA